MKQGQADVTSQSKKVGEAFYPIFDTVQEAVDKYGEDEVVKLVNSQVRTNEMNAVRAQATSKPSKSRLMTMAVSEITPEELQSVAGDPTAVNELIEAKMKEIEERLAQQAPAISDEDEASEDEA